MVVGDFHQFIVIPIAGQSQGSQNKNFPQVHTASSVIGINIDGNQLREKCKNLSTSIAVTVYGLQANEQLRDFIARVEVKFNVTDLYLAESHLAFDYFSHIFSSESLQIYNAQRRYYEALKNILY